MTSVEALKAGKSILDGVKKIVVPTWELILQALPEYVFLGTGLLSLITQQYPLGILFLAMIELGIFQNLLGNFGHLITSDIKGTGSIDCLPGLPHTDSLGLLRFFMRQSPFPSASIFFISGVVSYIMGSILNFRQELATLSQTNPDWKSRLPMSMILGPLCIIIYGAWRLARGCEGVLSVIGSCILGILLSLLILQVHIYLFGRDSINFLGIPLLADKVNLSVCLNLPTSQLPASSCPMTPMK